MLSPIQSIYSNSIYLLLKHHRGRLWVWPPWDSRLNINHAERTNSEHPGPSYHFSMSQNDACFRRFDSTAPQFLASPHLLKCLNWVSEGGHTFIARCGQVHKDSGEICLSNLAAAIALFQTMMLRHGTHEDGAIPYVVKLIEYKIPPVRN